MAFISSHLSAAMYKWFDYLKAKGHYITGYKGLGLLSLLSKIHANLQRSTFNKELRFLLRRSSHAFGLGKHLLETVVMIFGCGQSPSSTAFESA